MNEKLLAALDRSIADAEKICRRHCNNPTISIPAYQAAMRLIRDLRALRTTVAKAKQRV